LLLQSVTAAVTTTEEYFLSLIFSFRFLLGHNPSVDRKIVSSEQFHTNSNIKSIGI
jgi:hypothetical protein